MELYVRVRRACMVEGMSTREAARVFGLRRDTVRKMLEYSVPPGYRRQSPPCRPKLDPYRGVIDRILEDDRSLPISDCLIYGLAPPRLSQQFLDLPPSCGATRAQLCLLTLSGSVMHACGWYHSQYPSLYRQDGSDRYSVQPQILSQKVCAGRSRTNVPTPGYNIQSLFRILPQHTVALRCAKSLELPQNGFLRGNQYSSRSQFQSNDCGHRDTDQCGPTTAR